MELAHVREKQLREELKEAFIKKGIGSGAFKIWLDGFRDVREHSMIFSYFLNNERVTKTIEVSSITLADTRNNPHLLVEHVFDPLFADLIENPKVQEHIRECID